AVTTLVFSLDAVKAGFLAFARSKRDEWVILFRGACACRSVFQVDARGNNSAKDSITSCGSTFYPNLALSAYEDSTPGQGLFLPCVVCTYFNLNLSDGAEGPGHCPGPRARPAEQGNRWCIRHAPQSQYFA